MSSTTARRQTNPYRGPEAFTEGDRLYGRDDELNHLTNILIARRIVLLHAPSGAGKTSLIQAALIPRMRTERFLVLPPIRMVHLPTLPERAARLRYTLAAQISLESKQPRSKQLTPGQLARLTLNDYFARSGDDVDQLLIFDQFEELLTDDPAADEARSVFFAQLGEALTNPRRWALFSIREDYLGRLKPFAPTLPTRLETTFRLELLSLAATRQAIQGPAQEAGVTFSDAAADQLVHNLSLVRIQRNGAVLAQPGRVVEPVQLQVVCYRIWERYRARTRNAAAPPPISAADVGAAAAIDEALIDYYTASVATAAQRTNSSERGLRDWIEERLLSGTTLRSQAPQDSWASYSVAQDAIRLLVDRHLLRAEQRLGAVWYEVSHDRLVEPIRAANSTWREEHLSLLQRQSRIWEQGGRTPDLLLRGSAFTEASAWAEDHPDPP